MSASDIAYMRASDPWSSSTITAAMNTAFGTGGWTSISGYTTAAFTSGYDFVYVEGSDGNSGFPAFITANKNLIENFVSSGGHLLLNAGRNYGGGDISLGFGA